MESRRIDYIVRAVQEAQPRLGPETEQTVVDDDLALVHRIDGQLPTNAVVSFLRTRFGDEANRVLEVITPDVTALTIEGNPLPLSSPRSTAAVQRLVSIIIDQAVRLMGEKEGRNLHTLHGAAWRPSNVTEDDISSDIPFQKATYYGFQAERNGDKVADAMGDHFNMSLPWKRDNMSTREYTAEMVEMAGMFRLIGSPLSIGLGVSSPLYYSSHSDDHASVLTPYDSARLYLVWRGRTDMDVSSLWANIDSNEATMRAWAKDGTLSSSRAIWLPVRAQPINGQSCSFVDFVSHGLRMNIGNPYVMAKLRDCLRASYKYGPNSQENPFKGDPLWKQIEEWRQKDLEAVISAPKNRVENRVGETPFLFPSVSDADVMTPYRYLKAFHTFQELLFIWLSESPDIMDGVSYTEQNLVRTRMNEEAVLLGGLGARIRWLPSNSEMPGTNALRIVLNELSDLASALDRKEDLKVIWDIVSGIIRTPALRLREEVSSRYGFSEDRTASRFLPDNNFQIELLERSRSGMRKEIDEIKTDLPTLPSQDQATITYFLNIANYLINGTNTTNP